MLFTLLYHSDNTIGVIKTGFCRIPFINEDKLLNLFSYCFISIITGAQDTCWTYNIGNRTHDLGHRTYEIRHRT